jgi:BirA family biotin operon repressor/biotin-[acetyl-CoA-carboxylase] ligase
MTKDRVLEMLLRAGGYLSGEEMSGELRVSRAAVNGAVQALRREGYEINSSTNRGYLLASSPDRIAPGALMAYLPAGRIGTVECLETVDSTNDYLKLRAQAGAPDGLVAVANEQTRGKGRLGRAFSSPADKGVYLSMLLRPEGAPADIANITALVAVEMAGAMAAVSGVTPGIKWVNDLVLNRKKVCGILTEMSVEGETGRIQHAVVGIGVNVREAAEDFPPEIRHIATSLFMETGKEISRARLAAEMIARLDRLRAAWPEKRSEYLLPYRELCVNIGLEIRFTQNGVEHTAVAEDVDGDFGLVARLPDGGRVTLKSGEVSVRGLYGYV